MKNYNQLSFSETGVNYEPENSPRYLDNPPPGVVRETRGDYWTGTFRPDFVFKNGVPEGVDRAGHDDDQQPGFGGFSGYRPNEYQAPIQPGPSRKRSFGSGSSGHFMSSARKYRK